MSNHNPSGPSIPVWLVGLASLFGLAGVGFVGYTIYSIVSGGTLSASPTPEATPVAVTFPTRTAVPLIVPTEVPPPTETPLPPTPTTVTEQTITVVTAANVRSGPGTNYPALGGLPANTTAVVIGRDSTAQWFVIAYGNGSGQGWVSNVVASFSGDVNSLPVIAAPPPPPPSKTPPPAAPTNTPVPAVTNTPAASGPYMSNGIRGDAFWVENPSAGAGADIWFNFKVTNTTDAPVSFSVLAAHADNGPSAQSWTNASLGAHQVLEWRDHINIAAPGTYGLYLGICYGGKDACLNNQAAWTRLSNSVSVTVH